MCQDILHAIAFFCLILGREVDRLPTNGTRLPRVRRKINQERMGAIINTTLLKSVIPFTKEYVDVLSSHRSGNNTGDRFHIWSCEAKSFLTNKQLWTLSHLDDWTLRLLLTNQTQPILKQVWYSNPQHLFRLSYVFM